MLKRILFYSLFILLIPLKQDSNANTWERSSTKVPATSIISAIERGDSIIIDDCEIIGAFIRKGIREKRLDSNIYMKISESTFFDSVYFGYCTFYGYVKFCNVNFSKRVHFFDVAFFGDSSFSVHGCVFKDSVNIEQTEFMMGADFSQATFVKPATFVLLNFSDNVTFREANFLDCVVFLSTVFAKDADFIFTKFLHVTFFYNFFQGDVTFNLTEFNGWARFYQTSFSKAVDLDPQTCKHIVLLWDVLKGHLKYNPSGNLKLIKYYEENRQLNEADDVYLFLKEKERMEKPWYYRYPEFWFIQLICGYGVRPSYTLLWSLGIILIFAFFYTLRYNSIKEIEKEFWYSRRPKILKEIRSNLRKRIYNALYFSVHTFIIGIVSNWHPTDEFLIKTRKIRLLKFRTLSMIEGVLGWVLLVLFVVTLTRKFIR